MKTRPGPRTENSSFFAAPAGAGPSFGPCALTDPTRSLWAISPATRSHLNGGIRVKGPHLKFFADFNIHSKYSRGTHPDMEIPTLAKYAKRKGLALLGTGDFTQ